MYWWNIFVSFIPSFSPLLSCLWSFTATFQTFRSTTHLIQSVRVGLVPLNVTSMFKVMIRCSPNGKHVEYIWLNAIDALFMIFVLLRQLFRKKHKNIQLVIKLVRSNYRLKWLFFCLLSRSIRIDAEYNNNNNGNCFFFLVYTNSVSNCKQFNPIDIRRTTNVK